MNFGNETTRIALHQLDPPNYRRSDELPRSCENCKAFHQAAGPFGHCQKYGERKVALDYICDAYVPRPS